MGYKIVIPVIAIVAILFTSGLALDVFADHDIRGKSAYFFDCSGKNNSFPGESIFMRNFVEDNNGAFHRCAHNWQDAPVHKDNDNVKVDRHGLPEGSASSQDTWRGLPVEHSNPVCFDLPPWLEASNPCAWVKALDQFDNGWFKEGFGFQPGLPLPEQQHNAKLILRGYSWGGGLVAMMAGQERCHQFGVIVVNCDNNLGVGTVAIDPNMPSFTDTDFDFVWMIDPVGPLGFRDSLTGTNGVNQILHCCSGTKVFGTNVFTVFAGLQDVGGGKVALPFDWDTALGFKQGQQKAHYQEYWTNCTGEGHGCVNADPIINKDVGLAKILEMNNKPVVHDLPVITIDEGTETLVAIRASDTIPNSEIFSSTKRTEVCSAGSYNETLEQCEGPASCLGLDWAGTNLCAHRVFCPGGVGPNGNPWGIGIFDNRCYDILDSTPNIGCPAGTEQISIAHLDWCRATVQCPPGMVQQPGAFFCKGSKILSTTLEEFPNLILRAVDSDPDLKIISINNGAKTNCMSVVGATAGCSQDNIVIRDGSVVVFADDNNNGTSKVKIQAEDNGFPCDYCTGANKDISFNATGDWSQKLIEIDVQNVDPTVYEWSSFHGNNLRLILKTTDPSEADTLAGFNYTINWGDGSNEVIHGNSTDVFNHSYESGAYTVTVTATDKDGGISNEITLDVETPFWKLLQLIKKLNDDGTLNKGNANSFTSKVNSIIGSFEKPNSNSICNVAEALINEIKQGFEKPGKLSLTISDELVQKIKEEKEPLGCNGGVIDVVKQTIPDGHADQFTFTGDVSGTIGDGEKIRLGNLTSGTYSSTETVSSGWTLSNIFCLANDYSKDLKTNSVTINLQENEYAVCVFFNVIDEEIEPSFAGRGFGSASSDTASSGIRLHSNNSNPSSPQTSDDLTDDKKGSGGDEHLTRPTFGVSHETFETIVDSGFRFNDQSFTINDNFHTPFAQQTVNIGEVNSFEAKIYADKRLKVQEFLFGIPNVGEAHLAELGVEVWYDYNGEIEEVKAIQKSNVIDKETIVATHEKTKCQASDIEQKCDTTNVSVVFLEPLKDKVMAVKAIDYKGRYQITYLNEGVEIAGESLNQMNTFLIPSKVKGEGLVQVTQTAKYSPYWLADDERLFEMNSFGSFKQINQTFERFEDTGNPYTRVHSGFGGIIAYEQKRANQVFDSNEYISELPDSFAYIFPEPYDRMTDDMKAKMLEQEEIAKKIIEESKVQARW